LEGFFQNIEQNIIGENLVVSLERNKRINKLYHSNIVSLKIARKFFSVKCYNSNEMEFS